eukprot:GILI01003974.1.p1 GENE.GILI01003974.1~~GILI01003974.1.p1  ORF type:complete len:712 (-),score=239.90 GILI01003974.1:196-2331(-)
MKFTRQLEYNAVPEWRDYYIRYKFLKRLIKKQEDDTRRDSRASFSSFVESDAHQHLLSLDKSHSESGFIEILDQELDKVDNFFITKEREFTSATETSVSSLNGLRAAEDDSALKEQMVQLYLNISELRNFSTLNREGFRKILKKYDKHFGSQLGAWYLERVSQKALGKVEQLHSMITSIEESFARRFTRGDRVAAQEMLSEALHDMVIWERNTVWRDMLRLERRANSIKSERQEKFDLFKTLAPLFSAFIVAILLLVIPIFPSDKWEAQKCLSILVFVSIFWAFEVLPLYITAFVVPFSVVVSQVMLSDGANPTPLEAKDAAKAVFAAMSSSVIFMILGGFTIAAAMSKLRLDKELAYFVLAKVGTKPSTVLFSMIMLGGFLSMWVSNVAASVLCVSVITPLIQELPPKSSYVRALLIGIAFSCNIGGMLTPIASPQNAIALSQLASSYPDKAITFFDWMVVVLPQGLIMLVFTYFWVAFVYRNSMKKVAIPPRMSRPSTSFTQTQWFVIVINILTIVLWIVEGAIEDYVGAPGVIGLIPIIVFFGSGLLDKDDFNNLPWHTIYLVAGGSALGAAVKQSQLLSSVGSALQTALEGQSAWTCAMVFCLFVSIVTSFISHTVGALILMPIVIDVGYRLGHPQFFCMAVALALSGASALPISSFPNVNAVSILDETGVSYLRTKDFIKAGLPLTIMVSCIVLTVGYGMSNALGW